MRLHEGPRQLLAGGVASGVFLALFFGLGLVWWLAVVLGTAVYGATLLLVERKSLLSEVRLTSRVTAADIAKAADMLSDAGTRLRRSAAIAPSTERPVLEQMSDHMQSIRQSVIDDPEDFRAARQFINVYLPKIVQTVEGYVKVADQVTDDSADRLRGLGDRIRAFEPVVHRIRTACIENDLKALELEVDVLSRSLDRR